MAVCALLWALPRPGLAQVSTVLQQEAGLVPYRVERDGIPQPLATVAGDAARGRAIVANRQLGLCLLCHAGPVPEERFQGNLAPDLAGSGTRWSEAQLRLRIVDAGHINPDTIMPAYYRIDGLNNVAPAVRGKPILDAQQVEDVVAYLRSLKEKEGN
jgi:sulfur-oxidizing protein SoxX